MFFPWSLIKPFFSSFFVLTGTDDHQSWSWSSQRRPVVCAACRLPGFSQKPAGKSVCSDFPGCTSSNDFQFHVRVNKYYKCRYLISPGEDKWWFRCFCLKKQLPTKTCGGWCLRAAVLITHHVETETSFLAIVLTPGAFLLVLHVG